MKLANEGKPIVYLLLTPLSVNIFLHNAEIRLGFAIVMGAAFLEFFLVLEFEVENAEPSFGGKGL